MANLKRALFFFDDGRKVEGFDTGKTWNGFACPLLPKKSMIALLGDKEAIQHWVYDPKADAFTFVTTGSDPSEAEVVTRAKKNGPDGEALYDMSGGGYAFNTAPARAKR